MLAKCCLSSSEFLILLRKKSHKIISFVLLLFTLMILPDWVKAQSSPPPPCVYGYVLINVPVGSTYLINNPLVSGPGLMLPWPGSSTTAQTIVVQGGGKIEFDHSYTFAPGSDILFSDGISGFIEGGFIVSSGATLTVLSGVYGTSSGTRIRGCNSMFQGITVKSGSSVSLSPGCDLEDAFAAVDLEDNSSLTANGALFRKNFIGIRAAAPTPGGTRINVTLSLIGNQFYGQDQLVETSNGQDYPHHAILALDVVNVNVDASSGSANLFHGYSQTYDFHVLPIPIQSGNSNVTVKNAVFSNNGQLPIDTLIDLPNVCINCIGLASGSTSIATLIVTNCIFRNNYDGINFVNGNVSVTNSSFSVGNTHIHIHDALRPWTYSIRNNSFAQYAGAGVVADKIFPSLSYYLSDNIFYDDFTGYGPTAPAGSVGAASVVSANTANTNVFVLNNTYIKTSNQGQYIGGFALALGSRSLVESNDFTSTGGSLCELYLEGTRSVQAYRNSFSGALSGDDGVHATDAYQSSIICNNLNNLIRGTFFTGSGCDGTVLAENTFGNHTIGLALDEYYSSTAPRTTTIGQQLYNSNTWPTSGSPLEANFPVSSLSDPNYTMKLNNSKVIIQVTEASTPNYWAIPRYPGANDWFAYLYTSHPIPGKCPPVYVDPGDGGGHDGGGVGRLSATDENVIAGTQPVYNEFEATLWDAQVRLYRNLYEYPDLRPADSEAAVFYAANSETTYARLAIILSEYDQAMTADETTQEQLRDLYAQARVAQEEQTGELEALNQAASLLVGDVDIARNERLNSLQEELAAVEVSTSYETNLKNCLTVIIASALSDSPWQWTEEQEAILQAIAAQCKLPGGYGVVLARIMLNQLGAVEDGCTIEDRNAPASGAKQNGWKISPNPTSGNLQVSLPISKDIRTLDLFDQWGHKVRSYKVDAQPNFSWNIGDLINGVYYLKLIGGREIYSVQKITVQH